MFKGLAFISAANALDWAFWIAMGLVALSLLDFVLTEPQKKSVERYIYRASEQVIDLKIINWLRWWLRSTRRAHIVAVLMGVILIGGALVVLGVAGFVLWRDFSWSSVGIAIATVWIGFWWLGIVEKVSATVGAEVTAMLAKAETLFEFLVGYAFVLFVGGIAVAAWFGFLYWWIGPEQLEAREIPSWIRFCSMWVEAVGILWVVMFVDVALTLTGAVIVFAGRVLVSGLQIVAWRVVVFPKGPLAALILLATAILGITRALLARR